MSNTIPNTNLGTKWFTFYTKVRPWFVCVASIGVIADIIQYPQAYWGKGWALLYFAMSIIHPILSVAVFIKSLGEYDVFVSFVKKVLFYETVNIAYQQSVLQYIKNQFDFSAGLITFIIIFPILFFLWYFLNAKYFNKRLYAETDEYTEESQARITECTNCGYRDENFFYACPKCGQYTKRYVHPDRETDSQTDKIRFCRKCGVKLLDNSRFCSNCGTQIIEQTDICSPSQEQRSLD